MNQPAKHCYEFGPFRLDPAEHVLLRDGQLIPLTPKAFETLLVLVENGGHVVDKEELMNKVWPDTFVEEVNLAKNISALRRILGGSDSEQQYIETITKRGYRFVATVKRSSDERAGITASQTETSTVAATVRDTDGEADAGTIVDHPVDGRSKPASAGVVAADRTVKLQTPLMSRRALIAASMLSALVVAVLAYALFRKAPTSHQPEIRSLAVLPLVNLSGDPAQEYFADGMTEALITELAKIRALRVTSRTSAMQYKGANKSLPDIGRELNVDAVVQGSVQKSGDQVLINVQLIHAATDQHLWLVSYQRHLRDFLALQNEVGQAIANELRVKLAPDEQRLMASAHPVNPKALEAYLKGRDYFNQGRNEADLKEYQKLLKSSIGYFEQALTIDPNYALAYSGLAQANHWLASIGLPEFYPKAKEAAIRAIQIDETLAEAHAALAFILHRLDWDWAGSEREYKRAIELNPSYADSHHGYALVLSELGRHEEAIREINLAQELDPLIIPLKINMGGIYLEARQYDRAIEHFRRLLETAPDDEELHRGMGRAYIFKGMYDEGIAELRKAADLGGGNASRSALIAWAYALAGNRSEALKILTESLKWFGSGGTVSKRNIALAYTALGDKDQAFAWLEKTYEEHSESLLDLKVHPGFDSLRPDPRFADLLRRVRLAP